MTEKNLCEQLSDRIMTSGSKLIPKLFEMIATDEEARLMLATPGTAEELSVKMGKEAQDTKKTLDDLYHRGLVFKSEKGGITKYRMCRDLVQFHDATILWPEAPKEYHNMWLRYMEEEWPDYAKLVETVIKTPFTRVVPVGEAISSDSQVVTVDDVFKIIDESARMAVTPCTCRTIDGKCGHEVEVCLQVGKSADYSIDRGTGREISKKEAKEIIKRCNEAGLVHVIMNSTSKQHFICNCCSDCCQTMPVFIKEGVKMIAPSRFVARVDDDTCTGCENCVDRCIFKAIDIENEIARINAEKCMGCGVCVSECPTESIRLYEIREKESIPA